jgi:hypothetical protein
MARKGYHHMTQVQRCSIEALLSMGIVSQQHCRKNRRERIDDIPRNCSKFSVRRLQKRNGAGNFVVSEIIGKRNSEKDEEGS